MPCNDDDDDDVGYSFLSNYEAVILILMGNGHIGHRRSILYVRDINLKAFALETLTQVIRHIRAVKLQPHR